VEPVVIVAIATAAAIGVGVHGVTKQDTALTQRAREERRGAARRARVPSLGGRQREGGEFFEMDFRKRLLDLHPIRVSHGSRGLHVEVEGWS
jgi:hypothetical protein